MPLKCRCVCGCKLFVSTRSAGRTVKCPQCERRLRVPKDAVKRRRKQLADKERKKSKSKPRRSLRDKPPAPQVDLPAPEPPPPQRGEDQPLATGEPRETLQPARDDAQPAEQTPPASESDRKGKKSKKRDRSTQPPAAESDRGDKKRKSRKRRKSKQDRRQTPLPLPESGMEEISADAAESPASESPALGATAPSENELAEKQPAEDQPDSHDPVATESAVAPSVPQRESADDAAGEPDGKDVPVRGYQPDRDKVATVRWLAAALAVIALFGLAPALLDLREHLQSDVSQGLSRWAYTLLLLSILQFAYAVYLVQLPDWSSVWVVTIFSLLIATGYAAMCGLTLLASEQSDFAQVLELTDRLRGGKATGWCLIMLLLTSLMSYFSARIGARWRQAYV